jgi:hypothetical protein
MLYPKRFVVLVHISKKKTKTKQIRPLGLKPSASNRS